jgi:hypothetical protein
LFSGYPHIGGAPRLIEQNTPSTPIFQMEDQLIDCVANLRGPIKLGIGMFSGAERIEY